MGEIKPSIEAFFALNAATLLSGGEGPYWACNDSPLAAVMRMQSADMQSIMSREGATAPRYKMSEREKAEAMLPCFTPQSLVATKRGAVRVEELAPGDYVLTRDNGYQEVLWVGGKTYSNIDLAPYLRPILIKADALGDGVPAKDMVVSPQHRFLVSDKAVSALTGAEESFVAAKLLVHHEGVDVVAQSDVHYVQIMCARHEVLMVDGVWTESFQPSAAALEGLCETERARLFAVCPELEASQSPCSIAPARRSLRAADISKLRR